MSRTPHTGDLERQDRARIEGAPWRSEAQSRALFASLRDATIVIDERGTIVAASDSVRRVFQYEPPELFGRNVELLLPAATPDDGHELHTGFTNILGGTREIEVVRKDGTRIVCELSVARSDSKGGRLFTGAFRDVTDKKAAEAALRASEQRFHALFDSTFQFIGLLSPDGTLLEVNRTACEAAGIRREDVIGRLFWETPWWSHSHEMRQRIRDAVRSAAAGEFVRFEISQRGRGDTIQDVDFSLTPVKDDAGHVVRLIPEGRDVTQLKAAQRAETGMLRALAVIGESAAVLAHEIKSPVTAVNLALRAVADKLGEDQQVVLQELVVRMQRLERLMRGTLSFAKPLALKRLELDARTLFEDAVVHARVQLERTASTVCIDVPGEGVRFEGDGSLLAEVLSNLIVNALEAKGRDARVTLSARRLGRSGARLVVEDDGPGIPEDKRATIFKPFVTSKSSGTGLGLAICKKIVDEHGGTITVADAKDGGARFTIEIQGHD